MVVAGYLLCSTNLRILSPNGSSISNIIGLKNGPPTRGFLNPVILKERAKLVFELVPEKMSNLVIVNSALSEFDMIQACVEVGEKYADNIMVIPPLLARMTYAVEPLSNFRNPPEKEVILVVTITSPFVDFVILRRDANFELYIAECEDYPPHQCTEMFGKFYDYYLPDSTIFLPQKSLIHVADRLKSKFNPVNCFVKPYEKWDYVLLYGGMLRAIDFDEGFDRRYHIANFSSGYETTIENRRNKTRERHVLLPDRTPLPCNIYGYDGIPQTIKMFYFTQYYQVSNDLVLRTRQTTKKMIPASGSSQQIIGYVDERGIPFASPPRDTVDNGKLGSIKTTEYPKQEPIRANFVIPSVLFIDFATGSILEYDPATGNQKLEENVFDPALPSSSTSNPYERLYSILQTKSFGALHILTTHEILNEGKDLFNSMCNNVTYIPHIKAQLSYCFKKLKSEEHIEKFAIVLVGTSQLMDFLLFEFRSGHYYFIQRVQDLDAKDVEMKIRSEYVKDVFVFHPKGVQCSINTRNTSYVFEVRDFKNMALNGIFDMDENLRDLANTKDVKALFALPESNGTTTRSASDAGIFSQTSSPVSDFLPKNVVSHPQIKFLFRENYYSVELLSNGVTKILVDWTPLYLSMVEGRPEIGEKAKNDYEKFSKYVIYDVLKIIGKPLSEIKIDPTWGFKLTEKDGNILFEVRTPSEPKFITQELVMAAFLKAMKLRAESAMDTQIKEIRLSTYFKLTESQKAVFEKAALKNSFEILSFVVNDTHTQ